MCMYMFMCVYIYICIHIHMYVHMYVYTYSISSVRVIIISNRNSCINMVIIIPCFSRPSWKAAKRCTLNLVRITWEPRMMAEINKKDPGDIEHIEYIEHI